jgi:hypothetical protein
MSVHWKRADKKVKSIVQNVAMMDEPETRSLPSFDIFRPVKRLFDNLREKAAATKPHTITIYNCSAVLYEGNAAIGAVAGTSRAIEKFIIECEESLKQKIHVYGEHALVAMRQREFEQLQNA